MASARNRQIDASSVTSGLQHIAEETPVIIDDLMDQLAQAIRHAARQIVRVKSGHLRQGIRYKRVAPGVYEIYAFTRWGGIRQSYAVVIHETIVKYIEIPLMEIGSGETAKRIADELIQRLRDGRARRGAYKVYLDDDMLSDNYKQLKNDEAKMRRYVRQQKRALSSQV